VPLLKSGELGQLAVTLRIPEQPGRYTSYFRMQTAQGQLFGQRLWAEFVVCDYPAGRHARRAPADVQKEAEMAATTRQLEAMVAPQYAGATAAEAEAPAEEAVTAPLPSPPLALSPVPEGAEEDGKADLKDDTECDEWQMVRPALAVAAGAVSMVEVEEDCESVLSDFSTGVHQPLSLSTTRPTAVAVGESAIVHTYANACADLDFEEEASLGTAPVAPVAMMPEEQESSAAEESKVDEPAPAGEKASPVAALAADPIFQWHRELQMLGDMGFEDPGAMLPLLREHVRVPASETADGAVNTEGLHMVLASLLCLN
jgi:hypothetical protein